MFLTFLKMFIVLLVLFAYASAATCGNTFCEFAETCLNCPVDCPGVRTGPRRRRYCCAYLTGESPVCLGRGCPAFCNPPPVIGPSGSSGSTGATGPTGTTGTTGTTGEQGTEGNTGSSGATGGDGATGPTGKQGQTGTTGSSGSSGTTGSSGATGGTGPKGDSGNSGPSYEFLITEPLQNGAVFGPFLVPQRPGFVAFTVINTQAELHYVSGDQTSVLNFHVPFANNCCTYGASYLWRNGHLNVTLPDRGVGIFRTGGSGVLSYTRAHPDKWHLRVSIY